MDIEIRNGVATITGYVNAVERESMVLYDFQGEFVEVVNANTFRSALESNPNVGLMFNHVRDVDHMDMTLIEDNIGLKATVLVTDLEVINKAIAGELRGWSFGFYCNKSDWDIRKDGMRIRRISDIYLEEVSILDCTPAYVGTSIEMRGEDSKLIERRINNEVPTVTELDDPTADTDAIISNLQMKKRKFYFDLLK